MRRMEDADIQEQIRAAFLDLYNDPVGEDGPFKVFVLRFRIAQQTFEADLNARASIFGNIMIFQVKIKDCIDIVITHSLDDDSASDIQSGITANSPAKGCFRPTLVSRRGNRNNTRYTSTDVLQILKTKLTYLMPKPDDFQLKISDLAVSSNIPLTHFNVLRGNPPFYKKYGYIYEAATPILARIAEINWGQVKDLQFPRVDQTFGEVIHGILPDQAFADETPIVTVMQNISFEQESRFNQATLERLDPSVLRRAIQPNDLYLSTAILNAISELVPPFSMEGLTEAKHNPESAEWIASSSRLLLTSFVPQAAGGRRRSKSRKHRKQRKRKTLKA